MTQIALGIIRNEQGKVLIIQRIKEEKGEGQSVLSWAFPGGKVEENETVEEAVVREVLEETGYVVNTVHTISKRQHPEFPVFVFYIECEVEQEPPTDFSSDEINEVKWVTPKKLEEYFTSDLDTNVAEFFGL